ncbi:hypothetical protein LTR10_019755 [Elasticomyces elasticus]|uniref:Gryzun putative trafficking through Golgi domain-containing protein n=1 Tax=Exophiala sideris TaxID=1016849 RepID=A0ABR0JCG2_9EURO|nr:hypothetical protein LTR10_019755 [Elasticomyces elasticus]KAK5032118.1 hypothetical protein LTS07_004740 [Exophiala sideris]KAK5041045.1 hypothetical protein LTR13_003347 [Exophiala sideris]KAK5061621.1 hypothetical protein LTR69_004803 [Exophiala sideris]KAK5184320.1 hypothetical protein LTR44_002993 [Eurotiomycetes sp. CCFEE 6388]
MNAFPDDYVVHNLPLLLLSGLETISQCEQDSVGRTHAFLQEGGFRIKTDIPAVQGPLAAQLLEAFRSQDASSIPWHSQALAARSGRSFKILSVGRVYTLPPRKAPPPPHSPRLSAAGDNRSPPPPLVLHSPLSPLTPISPLYPDGLLSPLWITKHQSRLPCAFLTFFTLTSDPNTSSLQDNKLKSEINNIRNVFSSTNYKTRLVVVLLGDGPFSPGDLEDRFSTIRRAAGLDGKSIYFLPHNSSSVEVKELVNTVLSTLHSSCIDYYRDLSKHCRRKRNRNVVPQPTIQPGVSHVLSLQGWNVRYEFKLGVLAEFRQEMDAACRNYETAYEGLFSPELIDAIAVWSPRFNEARQLSDIIALRILRCLLWTDQGSTAVKSWTSHRDRVKDLVDRRGKGTESYGWEAWQSIWAKVMADLLSKSRYPLLNVSDLKVPDLLPIFAATDNITPGVDRGIPWEQPHHEGYWLDIARKCTRARREWALQIPEEDRHSPGRSPASVVASKAHLYDTYLAFEPYREVPADGQPGYDYGDDIVSTLQSAIQHFAKRGQLRKIEILQLETALEQVRNGSWEAAILTLQSLWTSQNWRRAGWWKPLQQVGWALLDCLANVDRPDLLVPLLWELSNVVFDRKLGTEYDLRKAMAKLAANDDYPSVAIDMDEALSPIVPAFVFSSHDVCVGEPVDCQLTLQARAHAWLPPIELTEVKVVFEGSLKPIYLVADDRHATTATSASAEFVAISLQESSVSTNKRSSAGGIASLTGSTSLSISPSHTRILSLRIVPREAGELSVASITLLFNDQKFSLAITSSDFQHSAAQWWVTKNGLPFPRTLGQESNAFNSITVQPKPPKVRIEPQDLRKVYYTNETINIGFDILNEEDEDAVVSVKVNMISPVEDSARVRWLESTASDTERSEAGILTLPAQDLGTIRPSGRTTVSICLDETVAPVDHEIEIIATYSLASEPETILTKNLTIDVGVIRPFEANYEFVPRLDKDSWPSFFEAPMPETDTSTPSGLRHQYSVTSNFYSFATEPVMIEAILLVATKISGGAVCSSSTGIVRKQSDSSSTEDKTPISAIILPDQTEIFDFDLTVQKLILGDRHTVGVDLALEIGWRRQDSETVNSTVLEVPKLVAAMSEPRVMLTISKAGSPGSSEFSAYRLHFMVENPSMHFLTFNVSMDASEDFAFSGPKASSLSLVPISRQSVTYRILPNKKDEWIGVHLTVVDAYFGQTLRVLPGGPDVKVDKKGNVLIKV